MHGTDCCQIRWSVEVAFCEERGVWRAIAHDAPSIPPDVLQRMLRSDEPTAFVGLSWTGEEIDDLFAVAAEGETAGQATMAACVKYEHVRATREFDVRLEELGAGERWTSRPAPRRTPMWRRAFED